MSAFLLKIRQELDAAHLDGHLIVFHQYKAKGPVSKSILGAAAFDDIVTLILFSLSISISRSILGTGDVSFLHLTYSILYRIIGAVLAGFNFGFIFNKTTAIFKVDDKKSLVILFLDFFVLSAMHFNFSTIHIKILYLVLGFILVRALGKYVGMHMGTSLLKMPNQVKKYAFAGLIPQGGIVLGLVLLVGKEELFQDFGNLLVGIIMGTTLIHEFLGPLISRLALKKAKEIN